MSVRVVEEESDQVKGIDHVELEMFLKTIETNSNNPDET